MTPRIWIDPLGNIGNRALQYIAAEGIRARCPEAGIGNVRLPEWGIDRPADRPPPQRSMAFGPHYFSLDPAGLADCLSRGVIDSVVLGSYAQDVRTFPSRADARRLLVTRDAAPDAAGFGADTLLCSLRGGEVLSGVHPDYLVLPAAFYAALAQRTGLRLVFFGQVGADPYVDGLRRALPDAAFVPGQGLAHDFEVIRRSANIVLSLSTFAWLAAWLSEAARIVVPVAGLLHPATSRRHMTAREPGGRDFLPLDDPAYEFVLFPVAQSVDLWTFPAEFATVQRNLADGMRFVPAAEMRGIHARIKRFAPPGPSLLAFDPAFYAAHNPDIAAAVAAGATAADHYVHHGFYEGRRPFAMDELVYMSANPEVGLAIAEGTYRDAWHHYAAAGRARDLVRTL